MNLSSIFSNVAHKHLVAVDLPDLSSNQHELNGVAALRDFFGIRGPTHGDLNWHYFSDDQETLSERGHFTFYDARAKTAHLTGRTEWRFYYYGSFLGHASVGDSLFLVRSCGGDLFGLVFRQESAWLRAGQALFGVQASQDSFLTLPREILGRQNLELLQRQIIDELALEITVPAQANDAALMLENFGRKFPSTLQMSAFARSQVEVDPQRPDEALVRWLSREEELFRALENVIIGERLQEKFHTVDEFIKYSLSVQNRRKSRMGFALQNHLAELFTRHRLRFKPQARTEGNNRPDFLFPGEHEYHDASFDAALLLMLGVKSTSKDRWRQVLDEADRISNKHLCTLEPGISSRQTEAMRNRNLTLVVPEEIQATYTAKQRLEILTMEEFIKHVGSKQLFKG